MKKYIIIILSLVYINTYSNYESATIPDIIESADKLAELNIINNNSPNPEKYNIENNITRREMLKIMLNLAKASVEKKCQGNFSDLNSSDWGCGYAETALKLGYIAPNKNYRPNDNVSKIEATKMIFKSLNIEPVKTNDWKEGYIQAGSDLRVFTDDEYQIFNYDERSIRGWIFYIASKSYINKLASTKKFEEEYTITYSQPFYEVGNLEYLSNSHDLKFIGREEKSNDDEYKYLDICIEWYFWDENIKSDNSKCKEILNEFGFKDIYDYRNITHNGGFGNKKNDRIVKYYNFINFKKGNEFIGDLNTIDEIQINNDIKGEKIIKELFNGKLKSYHGNNKLYTSMSRTYLDHLFGNSENGFSYYGNIGDISKVEFSPNGKNYVFYFSYLTNEEISNANKKLEIAKKSKKCIDEEKEVINGTTDPGDACHKLSYYLPKFHDVLVLNGNIIKLDIYKFKHLEANNSNPDNIFYSYTNLLISDNGELSYNSRPFFDSKIVDNISLPIGNSTKSYIDFNGYSIEIEGSVYNFVKSDDGKSIAFIVRDYSNFPVVQKKVVKIDKK